MTRRTRVLPPLVVILLLFALAIAGRTSRASSRGTGPVLDWTYCTPSIQSGGSDSLSAIYSYTASTQSRFIQPIAGQASLAHVSLDVHDPNRGESTGRLSVVLWDPVALVPDPTTVALRSISYGMSQLAGDGAQMALDPPVVLQSVAGVAEAPRANAAIDWLMTYNNWYPYNEQDLAWTSNGDPATPRAYRFSTGTADPLPGANGVLGHALCASDAATQQMRVCQSVMRCDTVPPPTAANALVQRFRVPQRTDVGWIELAFGSLGATSAVGSVAILDAQGSATPPTDASTALVQADLGGVTAGAWGTHFDFDRSTTLEAGHDYWLWVTTSAYYSVYLRRMTGGESGAFTSSIGELWRRTSAAGDWSPLVARVLAFRLIGTPNVVVGVEPHDPAAASLHLTAAPNPATTASTIRWGGARGSVRFEVFDPTGRRVVPSRGAERKGPGPGAAHPRRASSSYARPTRRNARPRCE